MATLQQYQQVMDDYQEHLPLTLQANGDPSIKGVAGRLFDGAEGNRRLLSDFRGALDAEFGKQAADQAFLELKLHDKYDAGKSLTVGEAKDFQMLTRDLRIQQEDLSYRQAYQELNLQAEAWEPATHKVAFSEMPELQHEALRCSSMDQTLKAADGTSQGEVRLHSWHLQNYAETKDNPALFELDEMVTAEMNHLQNSGLSERQKNLQARLNILETAVARAHENLLVAEPGEPQALNVFTAPECLFTGMEGTHADGSPTARGALTEEEMKKVLNEMAKMSERYPGLVLAPGTVMWSKPAAQTPIVNGTPTPCDMAFNVAPVFADGHLAHCNYKVNDGSDVSLTAPAVNGQGNNPGYAAPDASNGFGARFQVFRNDGTTSFKEAEHIRADMDAYFKPVCDQTDPRLDTCPRKWERELMKPPVAGQTAFRSSPHNHLFECQGKSFAIEVCADHTGQRRCAAGEFYKNKNAAPDSLAAKVASQGGVDVHLILAAGSALNKATCMARPGGVVGLNDMSSGTTESHTIGSVTERDNFDTTSRMSTLQNSKKLGLHGPMEIKQLNSVRADLTPPKPTRQAPVLGNTSSSSIRTGR